VEAAVKNRSIRLPKGAGDVKVSRDGLYAAYRLYDDLYIVVSGSGKTIKVPDENGGELTFFRWLPDRDMLVYSKKEPGGKEGRVCICTYDINSELLRSYPVIKGLPEGAEITGIELSPLTNVVYVGIKVSDDRLNIYKFDIMDNLHFVMTTGTGTVYRTNMYSDYLVYQADDGGIMLRNGNSGNIAGIPVEDANLLLAVDDKDYIYAAACEGGNITRIYRGKAGQEVEDWACIELDKPCGTADVLISPDGLIYTVDVGESKVVNIENGTATGYEGELLELTRDYAVSVKNGRLVMTVLIK